MTKKHLRDRLARWLAARLIPDTQAADQGCVDRLLSEREVVRRTGISRRTVARYTATGAFPKPLKLGATRIAWRESEINRWLNDCGIERALQRFLSTSAACSAGRR